MKLKNLLLLIACFTFLSSCRRSILYRLPVVGLHNGKEFHKVIPINGKIRENFQKSVLAIEESLPSKLNQDKSREGYSLSRIDLNVSLGISTEIFSYHRGLTAYYRLVFTR